MCKCSFGRRNDDPLHTAHLVDGYSPTINMVVAHHRQIVHRRDLTIEILCHLPSHNAKCTVHAFFMYQLAPPVFSKEDVLPTWIRTVIYPDSNVLLMDLRIRMSI